MKSIKYLVLLGMVLFAGCGSIHEPQSIDEGDLNPPPAQLPQDNKPAQPEPPPPISENTLSVNCVWQYDNPEPESGPPCDPEVIQVAIDKWNTIAKSLGAEDLFQYQPSNKSPQIMILIAYYKINAAEYEEKTGIKTALVQGGSAYWEYIARALGFAIGLPVNPDQNSIMKYFLQIDEQGTLGGASILQSDIDALDELL